jgi:hypothetical protein
MSAPVSPALRNAYEQVEKSRHELGQALAVLELGFERAFSRRPSRAWKWFAWAGPLLFFTLGIFIGSSLGRPQTKDARPARARVPAA